MGQVIGISRLMVFPVSVCDGGVCRVFPRKCRIMPTTILWAETFRMWPSIQTTSQTRATPPPEYQSEWAPTLMTFKRLRQNSLLQFLTPRVGFVPEPLGKGPITVISKLRYLTTRWLVCNFNHGFFLPFLCGQKPPHSSPRSAFGCLVRGRCKLYSKSCWFSGFCTYQDLNFLTNELEYKIIRFK